MKTTYDGKDLKEELMFVGVDIVSFVKGILDTHKEQITAGMSAESIAGYEFGINTVFDQINQLVDNEQYDDFIVLTKDKTPVEYCIEDLEKMSLLKEI